MNKEFYKQMEKDIKKFEKKYPGEIYSPQVKKEHEAARKRWAGIE